MTESASEDSCAYVQTETSSASLEEPWYCPHDALEGHKRCAFHHTAAEREEIGVSEADVKRRFTAALESGDPERRAFVGATMPSLEFDHIDFDHDDQHVLDLRHACILGDFVASYASFDEAVDLRDATLEGFRANDASFSDGLLCQRTTFEGEVDCYRGSFTGDEVAFTGAAFDAAARFDQVGFAHAATFDDATFTEEATFFGTEFHGRSIDIDDNTSFDGATFEDGVRFDFARFEATSFEETLFTEDASFEEATTTAPVAFDGATFESAATFDGATFGDDASFVAARFDGETLFRGATFEGGGTVLHHDADFSGVHFGDTVSFESGDIGAVTFDEGVFEADACFHDGTFRENASFEAAQFAGEAVFDETTFHTEATFAGVTFAALASYDGVEFRGSNNHDSASVTFDEVTFESRACFRDVYFREYASFCAARFVEEAVFEAALFDDEVTFEGTTFEAMASFPGVEFRGSNNHDSASVTFDEVTFEGKANFHHVWCTSASFWEVRFERYARFSECKFTKHVDMKISPIEANTVINFTDAVLSGGEIVHPDSRWVRCDLTRATVGDVTFRVEGADNRDLFEYLRFCETKFDGFDFAAHAHYLSWSNWRLHEFADDGLEYEYAVEMTTQAIEKTYQRAKICASTEGNVEASGKFRFKRQQAARKNYKEVALDPEESLSTRIRNGQRVGENLFLGLTCGHGMRLYRIAAMFIFFPIFPAFLYTFGGPAFRTEVGQIHSLAELATMGGVETFAANVHFSYITFLTIGYGNVVAKGKLGLVMVSLEAYASVVLGGLFIYVLIKRSEL